MIYGEGPTQIERDGTFSERREVTYSPQDVRFSTRDDVFYATFLGRPAKSVTLTSLGLMLYEAEIRYARRLGADGELEWSLTPDGFTVEMPVERPCEDAYVLRIERGRPF